MIGELRHHEELLRSTWRAFDPLRLPARAASIACIVRLSMITLQRPCDVARLQSRHVDFDGGTWAIRRRNRFSHVVPLTPLAVSLIRLACSLRRDHETPVVFQDQKEPAATLSGQVFSYQFGRIAKSLSWPGSVCFRDIEITTRTLWWSEVIDGLTGEAAEDILGHRCDVIGHRRRRNKFFWPESVLIARKREALGLWEAYLGTAIGAPLLSHEANDAGDER